jgi:uncharacterized protein (DUF885 family)
MPLSSSGGGGGVHASLADLPLSMPFDSVKHYEDYIARLHQIPKAFLQTEDVLRAGVRDHLIPVRFIAEKIPGQAEGVITANPFILPLKRFPSGFSWRAWASKTGGIVMTCPALYRIRCRILQWLEQKKLEITL